ncbi:MAG: c-type cytochrome biogenesis protein CcmI, partial [Hyphomicrobiaceae bacterium]|nr:c-type cytochrome biogenesis protein CcmI [Hyphomicrobiaceae bacterium]
MLLWLAFALLTAVVLAWVLAPLARPSPAPETGASADAGARAVYRDQLAEIEAERADGLIGATEAEGARIEISRRLLASAMLSDERALNVTRRSITHAKVTLAVAVAVPLLALVLYLTHGSPAMPSGAFASRTGAARGDADLARMVAQVEARLGNVPDDAKGWEVIAPVYLKLGRYADAATAYANAIRLQGDSVRLLDGLAEASMLANDGLVSEEARNAFEKLLKLEPSRAEPRFWLAVAKEQDGRLTEALADYSALLDEAPPEAPYRASLATRIKEVSARMSDTTATMSPGPSAPAKAPPGP